MLSTDWYTQSAAAVGVFLQGKVVRKTIVQKDS